MKKFLTFIFIIALAFTLSVFVAAAEVAEITITEEQETTIIDAIMNSTVWGSIVSYATMAIGIIVFVSKKLSGVSALIKSKADTKTILEGVNSAISETMTEIQTKLSETELKLAETQDNEKALLSLLSMYIMNDSKYNPTAKAEIMKYITGIKDFSGSVVDICDKATKAIEEAKKSEVKEETPTLDIIVNEAKSATMSLE